MIGRLSGKLETISIDELLVDVNGVGYSVRVPSGMAGRLEEDADGNVQVLIHTSVRDDAIDLYGFASDLQRELFRELTGVSRIGPKTAMSVLSQMSSRAIILAVQSSDVEGFTSVKGIGKKTAQRLILELKNSLDDLEFAEMAPVEETEDGDGAMTDDLRSALKNFGYDRGTIDQVIEQLDLEDADDVQPLIREALSILR